MMFIVILIALLIERFFDWSHLRQFRWYEAYAGWLDKRLTGKSPYLLLAITIALPLLIIGVVNCLVRGWWYGLASLLFQLAVLLYTLGPKNFWAERYASINAQAQPQSEVQTQSYAGESTLVSRTGTDVLDQIFIESNSRVFALIFWFAVLGPIGTVLYRCIALSASIPQQAEGARKIQALLDWLPVRVFTFLFALSGHFVQVLSCWKRLAKQGPASNDVLLTECGRTALLPLAVKRETVGQEAIGQAADSALEKEAIALLDRVLVMFLVIVAVAAWII